jgi:putative tryptophan/tyrosine transport system substrate-binding protein
MLSEAKNLGRDYEPEHSSNIIPGVNLFKSFTIDIQDSVVMKEIFKKTCIALVVALCLVSAVLEASCSKAKVFNIGVVMDLSVFTLAFDGFKEGMTELGYTEGKDVRYIFYGSAENNQKMINNQINKLLSNHIDLILTFGNNASLSAKEAVAGTGAPMLFAIAGTDLAIQKLVPDPQHPGGNVTGVRVARSAPKALEWLLTVVPRTRKVYVPYNPEDEMSVQALIGLDKNATQLGVELILKEIHSVESAVAVINDIPKNTGALFLMPSPTLNPDAGKLTQAAIHRGIPVGSPMKMDKAILVTFADDLFGSGKQAARLAQQIHKGISPADIPVEISDVSLTINLKTAEKLGLYIPDDILAQAKTVIR